MGQIYGLSPLEKAEGMAVSTWPDISHCPELNGVLRQMDQQVKWPQKMKAPDSFQNPGLWCDFHRDHGHKTEDCVAPDGEISNTVTHKSNQWRSREPPLLLPDYSEGKDQSLIAITEQTSGSTHRRTGGRRDGRRPVDRRGPDPPPQGRLQADLWIKKEINRLPQV